jgi:hypothetical protein
MESSADPPKSDAAKSSTESAEEGTADSTQKDQGVAKEPVPEEGDTTVRGLSWDLMGGGVPSSGALIEGDLGFSALPRVAYHYSMSPSFSVGGMISFDYAYWQPSAAFSPSMLLQAPVRFSLYRSPTVSIGLRGDPGLGFLFAGGKRESFEFAFLLNFGGTFGVTVQNRFIIGGGIWFPLAWRIPSNGTTSDVVLPLLVGPFLEFHVTPPLAIIFDVRAGPTFHSDALLGTDFGLAMMVGLAYRM